VRARSDNSNGRDPLPLPSVSGPGGRSGRGRRADDGHRV